MKIVCDACQAKYSISDDKVQGKVFKIRCKKCSNIIVVRGGAGAAEPAAAPVQEKETRTYDYGYDGGGAPAGDDAVWHVVINQDQVGPMTAAEVQQRFTGGEIDADTYIWREGFADWLPISQVDAFSGFVASGSSTAAVGGGGASAVASMFSGSSMDTGEAGTVRSDPGDLFAAASSARAPQQEDDGDLFGSKPSKSSASAQSAAANNPSAAASKLRGERNENSVLFSLGNLAQLASDKPAPVTAAPSSAGHATGAAGGEGSGLIDIRSMASAYMGGGAGAAKPATSSAIGSIDDLPVFGGGGFSEPAVIVPSPVRAGNNKLMYALIGSVGLLAVAAVILVVVMMKGKNEPAKVASNAGETVEKDKTEAKSETPPSDKGSATTPTPESGSAGSATTPPPTEKDKPIEATTPPPTEKDKPTEKTEKPKDKSGVASKPKDKSSSSSMVASKPKDKPAEKPIPESKDQAACDEVSCVLNNYEGACCSKYKKAKSGGGSTASKPAGGGDLPDSLDRAMISDGVAKVKARVMACGDKSSAKGQVKVSVKVNPDGSVGNVSVKTTPDPGLGSCVQSAMSKASFKKTQNGGSFGYPFVF